MLASRLRGSLGDPDMLLVFNTALVTGTTIELPFDGLVNVRVDWGDSTADLYTTPGVKSHTYSTDDIYEVSILGQLDTFGFDGAISGFSASRDSLVEVRRFGNLGLKSLRGAFINCLGITAIPNLLPSTVSNLAFAFGGASAPNGSMANWNVQNVTTLEEFVYAGEGEPDLSNWDVRNVASLRFTFGSRTTGNLYNPDLSAWRPQSALTLEGTFIINRAFNQDIDGWSVSQVTNFRSTFQEAQAFNQDLPSWDVSSGTDFYRMFSAASLFNGDISTWDVSNGVTFEGMFLFANAFNQDLSGWRTPLATNMDFMFADTTVFNQDLSGWCVPLIPSEPALFAEDSALAPANYPVWGTCP
jgi:hypothetical protein